MSEHRAPLDQAMVDAAIADLDELRDLLQRASRGNLEPDQVLEALRAYWHDHGPVLRSVALSVGELVRLQALSELYKWRDQLGAQLRARQPRAR
jgi:hypothetical protein